MTDWESKLAIVILNYNSADLTIENTNNIRAFSKDIHIIVVDNCSADKSVSRLSEALNGKSKVYFIQNQNNVGYAAGNNMGLKYADEFLAEVDTVCVMNPDVVVDSLDVLKRLYMALWSEDKLAVVTAQTIYNGKIRQPNDFGWKCITLKHMLFGGTLFGKIIRSSIRYNTLEVNENMIAYADIVQGCFFMAKKSVFSSVGFFDDGTFLYEEEAILGKKMQMNGYKEGVLVDVYIHHNHHQKDKRLIKKKNKLFDMKCFYDSRKYYIKKYSDRSDFLIIFACAFLNLDFMLKRLIKGLF